MSVYSPPRKRNEKGSKLALAGWVFLTLQAVGTGFVSLRYALPRVPFPAPLPNFYVRHGWLIVHAVFSSVALLAGPWQFLSVFRRRWLTVHRWTGGIYCGAVLADGWHRCRLRRMPRRERWLRLVFSRSAQSGWAQRQRVICAFAVDRCRHIASG